MLVITWFAQLKSVEKSLLCQFPSCGQSYGESKAETKARAPGSLHVPHSLSLVQKHLKMGVIWPPTLLGLKHAFHSLVKWPIGLKTILGIDDIFFLSQMAWDDIKC